MKKLLIGLLVSSGISIGLSYFLIKTYMDPKLLELAKAHGSIALDTPLKIGRLETQFFPLQVQLRSVEFADAPMGGGTLSAKFDRVDVSSDLVALISGSVPIRLTVQEGEIVFQAANAGKSVPEVESAKGGTDSPLPSFAPQLKMLSETRSQRKMDLSLQATHLKLISQGTSPVEAELTSLRFQTDLQTGRLAVVGRLQAPMKQTLDFSTDFKVADDWLEFSDGRVQVVGLGLSFRGKSNLTDHRQDLVLEAKIPDLAKADVRQNTSCVKPQAGSLDVTAKITTQAQLKQPQAAGKLSGKDIALMLDCQFGERKAKGLLKSTLQTDFSFMNGKLVAPVLSGKVDATALHLEAAGQFIKKPGDVLLASVEGKASQDSLEIQKFAFQLDRLKVAGDGSVAVGAGSSRISLQVDPLSLKGLERFFPAAQGQPLSGELEVRAQIDGPLLTPERLKVSLNPLKLQGFQTNLKYVSEDKQTAVEGLVQANVLAVLDVVGTQLSKASLNVTSDLSDLAVRSAQFQKAKQQTLKIQIKGNARGQELVLADSSLMLPAGKILIEGALKQPQAPVLDLKLSTQGFDIGRILQMMPAFKTYQVQGTAGGNLRVQGRYDMKGGMKTSPLNVSGSLTTNLSKVVMPEGPTATAKAGAGEGKGQEATLPPPREPMFENTPLYRNLALNVQTIIGLFQYGSLTAQSINVKTEIKNGIMSASGLIGKIFDGSVGLKSMSYPLLIKAPTITVAGQFQAMNLDKAITWFSAEYKEMVKGAGSGVFAFSLPDRSRPDFYTAVSGEGTAEIKDGFVSTLKFDEMANEKLSKIPGVGNDKKLASKGARGDVSVKYTIRGGKLLFDPLNILTPERNEMRSKGWVQMADKTCDVEATLFLAESTVGGSIFEANNDGQGRLKVPVRFSGSVFAPNLSIATEVVQTLLTNAAKLEGEKLKKRLTGDGEKRAKEIGEDIKKEAEKKLKELFK